MKKKIGTILLCGGKSSRFGQDKGNFIFKNKKLIEYSIELLRKYSSKIIVVGHQFIDASDLIYTSDIYPEAGPMGGLHAGLSYSDFQKNIVISCDIPFISEITIDKLLNHTSDHSIKLFQTPDQKIHPLIGLYDQNIIKDLEENLKRKQNKLLKFIFTQDHKIIKLTKNDYLESFININYQKDLEKFDS